jgi:sporulation protein YlmC with PRC-barrel domain
MNRLLTCTALGLVLGLSPALALDQNPSDDTQSPPALQDPAQPSEVAPSDQGQPSDPAAPIPGDTSEMTPSQPDAANPSAQAPSEPAMPPAAEAPQSIEPAAPRSAEAGLGGSQFLTKQESNDYLASNLIGESVYNNQDESIGSINDLVTDASGKVVAVLIGHGGFLGMGQKDVAVRFEDLKISREDNNDLKVVANMDKDILASAPDYQKLSEQNVAVGADTERANETDQRPSTY